MIKDLEYTIISILVDIIIGKYVISNNITLKGEAGSYFINIVNFEL